MPTIVRYTSSKTVRKPPAEVWEALTNWSGGVVWLPSVKGLQPAHGPIRVGQSFPGMSGQGTSLQPVNVNIMKLTPQKELYLEIDGESFSMQLSYSLESVEHGTKVSHQATVSLGGCLFLWLLMFFPVLFGIKFHYRGQIGKSFKNFLHLIGEDNPVSFSGRPWQGNVKPLVIVLFIVFIFFLLVVAFN